VELRARHCRMLSVESIVLVPEAMLLAMLSRLVTELSGGHRGLAASTLRL